MLKKTNSSKNGKTTRGFAASMVAVAALLVAGLAACGDGPTYTYPTPEPPKPKPPVPADYSYTELPSPPADNQLYNNGGDLQVITHYFSTSGGNKTRNYSMLYDHVEKVSYWVAFPMHRVWINGSGTRPDDDIYYRDGYVPSGVAQMPIEWSGYGARGYDRGHQLASRDRYATQEANDQTFYITNITPQVNTLNQGEWQNLEGWVRTTALEAKKPGGKTREDTLYVVTGCWIDRENIQRITTRGVTGAVPNAYYKVLLRSRTGDNVLPADDDCQMIGFWFENKAPGDSYSDHVVNVADIEEKTGHKFFPSIKSNAPRENCNPADWGQNRWTVGLIDN